MIHRPTAQIDDQLADDQVFRFGHVTFMDPRTCGELALVPVTRPFRSQQLASSWDRPHGSAAKYRFHKPQDKHGQTGCPTGSISSIPHMQKDNGVKILQCASCICDLRSRVITCIDGQDRYLVFSVKQYRAKHQLKIGGGANMGQPSTE